MAGTGMGAKLSQHHSLKKRRLCLQKEWPQEPLMLLVAVDPAHARRPALSGTTPGTQFLLCLHLGNLGALISCSLGLPTCFTAKKLKL